jgi:NAD(P)H-dependent flavin oxidoreductase YrpB (nitropropane dioxygenase family)
LLPLLSAVLDAVSVPVLAAGGIGSGRSIAAVLVAGAAGVRMGTRFIAAEESNAHPDYVKAVIAARAEDAVRTSKFHVECPLCPSTHGVLRQAIEAADAIQEKYVAEIELDGERHQIERFRGIPPFKGIVGHIEAMACYAGQSVGDVKEVQPAAEIVAELVESAERLLHRSSVIA